MDALDARRAVLFNRGGRFDLGRGAWHCEAMIRNLAALALLGSAALAAAQSIMTVPRMDVAKLHELVIAKQVVVIDVRTADRYRMQHIPGAILVPLGTEKEAAAKLANETRPIVTYCTCSAEQTAARSAITLGEHGIKGVQALKGGLAAWEKAGYPMEK